MNQFQVSFLSFFSIFSLLIFIKGTHETIIKKNPFGETPLLSWMGIFVWGDTVIISLFWFISSLFLLLLKNWPLFLLTFSVFWLVRSLGETIYWINQQFSAKNRNPPENLRGYRFFSNDSIWFIYQLFWQVITIISIISTIYLASQFFHNPS